MSIAKNQKTTTIAVFDQPRLNLRRASANPMPVIEVAMYLVVGIPGFVLWSILLLRAARREALHIREGLVPYVRT